MRHFISRTLLKGLSIVAPVTVALYVLVWLVAGTENAVRSVITFAMPDAVYVPGMGLAIVLMIIFVSGLLMYPWLTRKLVKLSDGIFRKIPIFGSVYSPVKDLMDLFGGDLGQKLGDPVMVKIPNTEMETLGFITRRDGQDLPEGMVPDNHKVIYVQWSSQVGGYCFIVPDSSIRTLDINVEEGMRWALTAGLSAPKRTADKSGDIQETPR